MENTLLLQVASEVQLAQSLLEKPLTIMFVLLVLFLGAYLVIKWLAKRYEIVSQEKTDLAKDVIKLASTYEAKFDTEKDRDAEIKSILIDIRESVKSWKK